MGPDRGTRDGAHGDDHVAVVRRQLGDRRIDLPGLRRRLREIFRLQRPLLPEGLWMVIVPRRAAVNAQFAALAEEWRVLSVRAGFLKA